ncbi:MAG: type II and III secretion system protein, partial [Candidatus Micrarchaeia archaeon]
IPIPSITTTAGVQTTAIDFRDFGIVLVVQPTVDMQRNVSMVVAAELSEPSKDLAVQNVPGFISRYVETSVLLKDRNTLMLSGLTSQSDSKGVRKVPILGSIPILGELFKSRSMETQSKDLVIFITPYVYSVDEIEKLEKKEIDRMKEKYEEYMNTKEIKISD